MASSEYRWERWREQLWSNFVRLECSSTSENFFGRVEQAAEGSNRLCAVHSTAHLVERTANHTRSDPHDIVLFLIQRSGYGYIEQDGRQARLDAGDFGLIDTSRPYRLSFDEPFEHLILRLPRQHFADRLPGFNRLTAGSFVGCDGPGRVATGMVIQLAANAKALGDDGIASFEQAAAESICTAIQLAVQNSADAEQTRLRQMQTRLRRSLRNPDLDLASFAAREGISLRTLQRLFQLDGTTPKRWVAERRMCGVAADLRSPALKSRSVTEIALSWGFNDLSHFGRSFHQLYGRSPKEWRKG